VRQIERVASNAEISELLATGVWVLGFKPKQHTSRAASNRKERENRRMLRSNKHPIETNGVEQQIRNESIA
jgi:hypothetical protein